MAECDTSPTPIHKYTYLPPVEISLLPRPLVQEPCNFPKLLKFLFTQLCQYLLPQLLCFSTGFPHFPFFHDNSCGGRIHPDPLLIFHTISTSRLCKSSLSFDDQFSAQKEDQAVPKVMQTYTTAAVPFDAVKVLCRFWPVELSTQDACYSGAFLRGRPRALPLP